MTGRFMTRIIQNAIWTLRRIIQKVIRCRRF